MSQTVTCSVTRTHNQCSCAATFQPVSSIAHEAAAGGIAQRVPRRLAAAGHPRDRAADRTAVHVEAKPILQDRGDIRMGQAQPLVHRDGQRQRVRPQLHGGRAERLRRLPRIAPVHPSVAHHAATDGHIDPLPDRLPHDLVLILRRDLLHGQRAPAATSRGRWPRDHFINVVRDRFPVPLAVRGASLATRALRGACPNAVGKRSRLPLGRSPVITTFDLTAMLIAHVFILWLGFYLSIYGVGAVSLPGMVSKILGVVVLCFVLPFGGVVAALIVGLILDSIGVQQELVWLYLDSWTPFEAWQTFP